MNTCDKLPKPQPTTSEYFVPYVKNRTKRAIAAHLSEVRHALDISDGAKLTYIELLDHDYEDKQSRQCKGYVWPSVKTLAQIRGKSERTIREHLQELVERGLIMRMRRRNTSSMFRFLEPPQARTEAHRCIKNDGLEMSEGEICEMAESRRSSDPNISAQHSVRTSSQTPKGEQRKTAVAYIRKETTENMKLQQNDAVVEKLQRLHIAKPTAESLAARFEHHYIKEKITLLEQKLTRTGFGNTIHNPAAWLIKAIEENYQPTEDQSHRDRPMHTFEESLCEFDEDRGVVIIYERGKGILSIITGRPGDGWAKVW